MTLREKHRWILIEVIGESVNKNELIKAINQKIFELFGTIFGSKIRYRLVEFNEDQGIGLVRVNLDAIDLFRTALLFLREINGKKVLVNDLLVSGTIKALRRKVINREIWSKVIKEKNLINKLEEE